METVKGLKKGEARKIFIKKGTCAQALFYILNREFKNNKLLEEQAVDPLAGGILRLGYQCGMLWGASLAAGAEAYRRFGNSDKAIAVTVEATQNIMESFKNQTQSIECYEITDCDWNSKLSMAKYFLKGSFLYCFRLAEEWAPAAIETAFKSLEENPAQIPEACVNCSTETAKKMGATDEQIIMVAGFAGGLGLSGNACGALAAGIWLRTLDWCRTEDGKNAFSNPEAEKTLDEFYEISDYELLCEQIAGKKFSSLGEHSDYIKNGGCAEIIAVLSDKKISLN